MATFFQQPMIFETLDRVFHGQRRGMQQLFAARLVDRLVQCKVHVFSLAALQCPWFGQGHLLARDFLQCRHIRWGETLHDKLDATARDIREFRTLGQSQFNLVGVRLARVEVLAEPLKSKHRLFWPD